MPPELNKHDGTSLLNGWNVLVEDFAAAAVANVENVSNKQDNASLQLSPTQRSGADGRVGEFDAVKHCAIHCANRWMHAAGNSAASRVGSDEGDGPMRPMRPIRAGGRWGVGPIDRRPGDAQGA